MAKRKITPQTRVKLSQAAKKRRRGIKGTSLGGKFMAAATHSGVSRADMHDQIGPKKYIEDREQEVAGRTGTRRTKHNFPEEPKTVGQQQKSRADNLVTNYPERAKQELAYRATRDITGKQRPSPEDIGHAPVRVSSKTVKDLRTQDRQANWRKGKDLYSDTPKQSLRVFMEETLVPEQRQAIDGLLTDPNSSFNFGLDMARRGAGRYNPGQRRRLEQYQRMLQEQGRSHEEALGMLREETRGRKAGGAGAPKRETGLGARDAKPAGRKSRYVTTPSQADRLSLGVSARGVQRISEIKDSMPDASDRDLVRVQQSQRESLFSEFQKNQVWTHETRRANILGQQNGTEHADPDKVVFFTTSLGGPSPSVPSDSLVGQYIIKRRRKTLRDLNVAKGSEMRGKFPEAVRDFHIMEFSTGISLGAVGEVSANRKTGARIGSKRTPRFGQPVPIGSQIMYDSQGRAMYDQQGNARFSEGLGRRFRYETPDAGLRIFVG